MSSRNEKLKPGDAAQKRSRSRCEACRAKTGEPSLTSWETNYFLSVTMTTEGLSSNLQTLTESLTSFSSTQSLPELLRQKAKNYNQKTADEKLRLKAENYSLPKE